MFSGLDEEANLTDISGKGIAVAAAVRSGSRQSSRTAKDAQKIALSNFRVFVLKIFCSSSKINVILCIQLFENRDIS